MAKPNPDVQRCQFQPERPVGVWRRWLLLVFLVAWIALIFSTSCTVIRPQEFFEWFHKNIFRDEAGYQQFQVFWGFSWFAISDEWHQSFAPGRFGTVSDVLIDGLGVLVTGFLLLGRLHNRDRDEQLPRRMTATG